jgi:hypothetical protein
VTRREHQGVVRRRDRESGQAMVEFALILFPLLILVSGIIWFGIGLNYWLDMQRIANQGARWAAVNNWPTNCPVGSDPGDCSNTPPDCFPSSQAGATLQHTLRCQALTNGLQSTVQVEVCYPDWPNAEGGDPVFVRLETPFTFVPILGIGTIELGADATMRLEQDPDVITGAGECS